MKILVAGDFCPQYRVRELIEKGSYETVFGSIKKDVLKYDYSIVNLECPVVLKGGKAIPKLGPNLYCSEKGIEAIKWAGFNCVTLANNHFLDYGEDGVIDTLDTCNKLEIDFVGGGININNASKILYKNINDEILAIINCCEHEFSIATETTSGSNPLNPIQLYYKITEAKDKADYVLVIVHGGHEQFNLPSPRMKELYHFFIDLGADTVVNHHQHCYSGYECYKGKPIFYGLGNFCFDTINTNLYGWNEGFMASLEFARGEVSYMISPYEQCKKSPVVSSLPRESFNTEIDKLNKIICDDKKLAAEVSRYYCDSMNIVKETLEPVQNKYLAALIHRGWWPSSWSKKWMIRLQNYILCEAHRDKVEYFLKNFKKQCAQN